jgi:cell division protein FtsQ
MTGTHVATYPLTPSAGAHAPAIDPSGLSVRSLVRLLRFACLMAALLAAAAFPQSSFFTITQITVQGAGHVSAADLLRRSGLHRGQTIASIDPQRVARRVAQHPWVATARVRVSPTGAVTLFVQERVPHAALPYRYGYVLLDHTGVALEFLTALPSVPVIGVDGVSLPWVRLGDRVPSGAVLGAVQALTLMPQEEIARGLRLRVDRTGAVIVTTADGVTVLLGQPRGLGTRAAALPQVLAAIRRQHLHNPSIDLRFAGSVILRGPPPTAGRGVRR